MPRGSFQSPIIVMNFVEGVKNIVDEFGAKKIAESSFIGLLDDYRAFDNEPQSSKNILKFWESHGMLERISNMSAKGSQWKNEVSDIIYQTENYGFDRNVVSNLLHELLLGMGIVRPTLDWNKEFQSGPASESERKTSGKKQAQTKSTQKSQTKSQGKSRTKKKANRKEIWEIMQFFAWGLLILSVYLIIGSWDTLKNITKSSIGGWFSGRSHEEGVLNVSGESFTVNGITFKMVAVEGGTFEMGSETGDEDEHPVHSETVGDFMIGETEVTQALWETIMENNPSKYKGEERPVHKVSWYDCQTFIKRLNKLTGKKFRLPTEAEWEYAARGGHKSKGIYKYAGSQKAMEVAWFGIRPHEVKKKRPNELGVYDMSGNVEEWCEDSFDSRHSWQKGGKALRGGSYTRSEICCTVFHRDSGQPDSEHKTHGFRLLLEVSPVAVP